MSFTPEEARGGSGSARGARHRGAGARRPLGRRPGGRDFMPQGERTTIGRSPDCDIFLDDVTVSRKHAVLVQRDGGLYIEDLGSLNGTFLNRKRIESRGPARERRRAADRQVQAHLPPEMTTAPAPSRSERSGGCSRSGPSAGALKDEFPDISISKIRYLEDQGLLAPKRTQGGYRLFGEDDVERLRDDPPAPARRVPAAARDPPGARLAVGRRRSAAGSAPAGWRARRRARAGRALRARRRSRRSSRASSRSSACCIRAATGSESSTGDRRRHRGRLRKLVALRHRAAAPAHVPHRRRPRGGAAASGARAGAALAQSRAPRRRHPAARDARGAGAGALARSSSGATSENLPRADGCA